MLPDKLGKLGKFILKQLFIVFGLAATFILPILPFPKSWQVGQDEISST
jgi:hypothetical protein